MKIKFKLKRNTKATEASAVSIGMHVLAQDCQVNVGRITVKMQSKR